MELYPLIFEPIYKEKVWGGKQIKKYFKRCLDRNINENIGESWELAAHPHGTSVVSNGPLQGQKLTKLIRKYKKQITGQLSEEQSQSIFPLLIKFLDINKNISVQVHPDNNYARLHDNEWGKTEMWYIISARPGARLNYGLKPGTSKENLIRAIEENKLEKFLYYVEVKRGDTFYIPAGLVHTLDEGILLAEIQQNSDATYRLYDWGRTDKHGNPRPLHIKKALDVINFQQDNLNLKQPALVFHHKSYTRHFLVVSPYFITEKIQLSGQYLLSPTDDRFNILIILNGEGNIICKKESYQITQGNTILLPAQLDQLLIRGKMELLMSYLPPQKQQLISNLNNLGFSLSEINTIPGFSDF